MNYDFDWAIVTSEVYGNGIVSGLYVTLQAL